MRLKLTFEIKRNELPKNNKNIWLSFIKYALNYVDPKYKEHFFGREIKEKDYSFCVIFPHPKFIKNTSTLILNSYKPAEVAENVTMYFSSSDEKGTSMIFHSVFREIKGKNFFLPEGNSMFLKRIVKLEEDTNKLTNSAVFISPRGGGIMVRSHNRETNRDRFYTIEDAEFGRYATDVIRRQALDAGFPEKKVERIIARKADEYNHNMVWSTVHYRMPCKVSNAIHITAPQEILKYLYQVGIGSKHSMGYGYISDIIVS